MAPTTLDSRPPHHEFALELERARREAGLKPKEIAEQLYLDPRTVRRYLNGERLPSHDTTEAWERACKIEAGRLLRIHPETVRGEPLPAGERPSAPAMQEADPGSRRRSGSQAARRWAVAGILAVLAAGAAVAGVTLSGGASPGKVEQVLERAQVLKTTYAERTGGSARTWSDFTIAGGDPGPPINGSRTVRVTCRVRGFEVSSGNQWWYLVASAPWSNRYFATGDAFYNQRRTAGVDFRKTPFVDPRVPLCP